MSSSSDAIFGLGATQVVIAPGGSFAQWVDVVPREGALILKYFSGGTLEIQGSPLGSTMPGASLAAVAGTGYIMGTSEVLSIGGPCRFYMLAGGTTCTAMILRGLTAPGFNDTLGS
jgi:hypothetical protein